MDTLLQDLRYTFRQLRKSPGFTAIVVLTLALGIGANSALFGIVNAALLRPLPYPHADRLVSVSLASPESDMGSMDDPGIALLMSEHPRSFQALAAYKSTGANLTAGDEPEYVTGASISDGFFQVMGVRPMLGRAFTPGDAHPGSALVTILGRGLWARDFGSDPHAIGQTVKLDDRSYTIVGVMPAGFDYPNDAEYWVPLELPTAAPSTMAQLRSFSTSYLIGRLQPGVSASAATKEVAALRRSDNAGPGVVAPGGASIRMRAIGKAMRVMRGGDLTVQVTSLHERIYGDLRPALLILLGTVACVLLIACA
ncbi:MAG TPA: ABC transporter permease, partial [Gemmatimonadaceae bacterium]|nr:ABC transporter permease [Gemmatimonadaceae bacterium]